MGRGTHGDKIIASIKTVPSMSQFNVARKHGGFRLYIYHIHVENW